MKLNNPSGTRDYVLGEAELKRRLEQQIYEHLTHWGYLPIETPTIEFLQTYVVGFEELQENQLYKLSDDQGNILTLRADMTIPIARIAAGKFRYQELPLRFSYCGSVFKNYQGLSGNLNEVSDSGVELIGLPKETGDLEILVCALETLDHLEAVHYILELGDSRLFDCLCEKACLAFEKRAELAQLIDEKKVTDLKEYLEKLHLPEYFSQVFQKMVWWNGRKEVLKEARDYLDDQEFDPILEELGQLYDQLVSLGYREKLHLDLGKIGRLNYYTGIIFDAFAEGAGPRIISGGRYDQLLGKFGYHVPAVGFSIKINHLVQIMKTAEQPSPWIINFPPNQIVAAIKKRQALSNEKMVILQPEPNLKTVQVRREERC